MEEQSNLLEDIPEFSATADRVHDAICRVQIGDDRVELFGRRFARAITAYEAGGSSRSGPLDSFLLYGTVFSPIPLMVEVAAETWLGRTWDRSPSFLHIDCSSYQAPVPGILAPLIGPLPTPGQVPLLAQIDRPHFLARRPSDLEIFQAWLEGWNDRLIKKSSQYGVHFPQMQQFFSDRANEQYNMLLRDEKKKNGPFGSVVFFDGVNRASPFLRDVILQIVSTGQLALATGARVDFSNAIIMLSIYDDDGLFRGDDIGFAQGRSNGEKSDENTYRTLRKKLYDELTVRPFVQSVAENLIIVPERTRESQKRRTIDEFKRVQEQFGAFDIILDFSDKFQEAFMDDTKENVSRKGGAAEEVYTEERIKSGIRRHVLNPLHRLLLAGKVQHGASLQFTPKSSETSELIVELQEIKSGKGELLTPDELRDQREQRLGERLDDFDGWPEWLKKLNERVGAEGVRILSL